MHVRRTLPKAAKSSRLYCDILILCVFRLLLRLRKPGWQSWLMWVGAVIQVYIITHCKRLASRIMRCPRASHWRHLAWELKLYLVTETCLLVFAVLNYLYVILCGVEEMILFVQLLWNRILNDFFMCRLKRILMAKYLCTNFYCHSVKFLVEIPNLNWMAHIERNFSKKSLALIIIIYFN